MHLLNVQILWMMFMRIIMIIIQAEKEKSLLKGLRTNYFQFVMIKRMSTEWNLKKEEEEIKNIRNENSLIDYGKLMRKIGVKERKINRELVKKYFFNNDLGNLLKNFKKSKNNLKRNKIQVNMINSWLEDLKEEITNMSEEEKNNRKTKWNSKYCWRYSWA